jgi:hypothetical protein
MTLQPANVFEKLEGSLRLFLLFRELGDDWGGRLFLYHGLLDDWLCRLGLLLLLLYGGRLLLLINGLLLCGLLNNGVFGPCRFFFLLLSQQEAL